jgi:preprotein translocase subunit YajC
MKNRKLRQKIGLVLFSLNMNNAFGYFIIPTILPFILIFAIMYFLLIRPQQKKVKEHKALVEAVKKGDEVVTQGGLIGKITKVKGEGRLEVEIASGVKVQVVQATIAQVINKTETKK